MKATLLTITALITVMIGYTALNGENLVKENGKVAAKKLPFDQKTAQLDYETATFGIG